MFPLQPGKPAAAATTNSHAREIRSIVFLPDGKHVVTGGGAHRPVEQGVDRETDQTAWIIRVVLGTFAIIVQYIIADF